VLSARYNLLTKTEQFDDVYWATRRVTKSADVTVAPNGTTTADALVENTENNTHQIFNDESGTQRFPVSSGAAYTFSVFLKKGNGATAPDWVALRFIEGFATNGVAFNLNTGAVGSSNGATGAITDAGSGWYRCAITATANASTNLGRVSFFFTNNTDTTTEPSYAGSTTSNVFLWGADLRVANDGVNIPPYQRVNTATDYDTQGFPLYLRCDGVDDGMVTNSIDFTGTDKMTVFAGVRKLSDAARGMAVEFGDGGLVTNQWGLNAPVSSTPGYAFRSAGTSAGSADLTTGFPSPTTNVLTGIGDISGDRATLRINGTQAASSTADQGTGPYGKYPLYIGRRGGTTLPFNGRFYSLIVRGAATTDTRIAQTERWVNKKTGAY
jgi:hypothetical protein